MDLEFVRAVDKALDGREGRRLGLDFTRGSLPPPWGARLLTVDRLMDMLTYRTMTRTGQVLVLQQGSFLPPKRFMTSRTTRGEELEMVDTHRLGLLLREGCQVVVGGIEKIDPVFDIACRALQWLTGARVYATAFLATGEAGGFNLHVDTSDSLVLQLEGTKSWQVRGESMKAPLNEVRRSAEPSEEILWEGTLGPGEAMSVPRGYWHTATRSDQGAGGYSLHVTFGVVRRTGVDWLRALTELACNLEVFRRDLTDDTDEDEALAAALSLLARTYRPTHFLQARTAYSDRGGIGWRETQHPYTGGAFGPVSEVVCLTDFPPHLTAGGGNAVVTVNGRRLTFPAEALPALRLLVSGRPVVVEEVSRTTGVDAAELVRPLLDAHFCTEVTGALAGAFTALDGPESPES
ncbi:JmjC domain-containing protein [Streptomyces sp. Ru62]|uniref:JmjC domain-containing protein n=1 Tax=Streptomyces sp. Ru62 TaxID=2080745 RepID=UPI0015E2A1C1|nr:cupin domain-containing protein [Streptomyces sp. Ru62]